MAARWTQQGYQELVAAYMAGATRVTYQDRTIEYESRRDMLAKIREAEADLGIASTKSTRILPSTRTGLG